MADQIIICPNCGKKIPVSEALKNQIEASVRETYEAEAKKKDLIIQAKYEQRLKDEKARIEKQAHKEAERITSKKIEDLREQIAEKEDQIAEAQKLKGQIQKQQDRLASREKALESEISARTEKALRKAKEEYALKLEAEYHLRELELEKKLSDAKSQAADLKRKLEQGSQQTQGEVIELELERTLKKAFPEDQIEPISKGKLGADIIHKVFSPKGQHCGTIIWETKNTRNWNKAWLNKLRNDQRRAKAEIAVLVSIALPKEIPQFAQVEGVWVSAYSIAIGVATALRANLIQVALLKFASERKDEKMELIYEYLSGTEFRHRVEAIVEAFRMMQDDLGKERQSMERHWAKREKHIQLVIENVSGMYGDMQALAGHSLPKIRRLELPATNER